MQGFANDKNTIMLDRGSTYLPRGLMVNLLILAPALAPRNKIRADDHAKFIYLVSKPYKSVGHVCTHNLHLFSASNMIEHP